MRITLLSLLILLLLASSCHKSSHDYNQRMDLSGIWKFQLDSANVGLREKWFARELNDSVRLPVTTDENKKGIFKDEKAVDRLPVYGTGKVQPGIKRR